MNTMLITAEELKMLQHFMKWRFSKNRSPKPEPEVTPELLRDWDEKHNGRKLFGAFTYTVERAQELLNALDDLMLEELHSALEGFITTGGSKAEVVEMISRVYRVDPDALEKEVRSA